MYSTPDTPFSTIWSSVLTLGQRAPYSSFSLIPTLPSATRFTAPKVEILNTPVAYPVQAVHMGIPLCSWVRTDFMDIIFTSPAGAVIEYVCACLSVCLSVTVCDVSLCPRGYLRNHRRDLYLTCAYCLWSWLGPTRLRRSDEIPKR